ncbi:helicase-related protein [Corynebacterium sp. P6129]|uniref:DEAD/DEAH box helicase n=1 Tax=Corynebacterium antarcticum TaxID=2800405 RepID=UPI00226089C4|nr:helicase-related protein [Corynebacterium antarcticum]MCX7492943.1 helicase-related protein [Corynebacterium antarcticum]
MPQATTDGSSGLTTISDELHRALAPGRIVEVRDEEWLITSVFPTVNGMKIRARGVSDFVRDTPATFYTELDRINPLDADSVTLKADGSPNYRHSRLWLESILRKTPVPLYETTLAVSNEMLTDPLDYQLSAVKKALQTDSLRPRLLIADAVGLGKTIEIGMILSELVRRGRGDRILIVTPRHVLEQMQQEMWTRFALPFVRLDSVGIQRVRQKLPATRNPFTYYNRAIISIDTLKMPKYRAQLEKVGWDAVVLDEAHNVTNAATKNNDLARLLAPNTEALILASATPHNGKPESFAELLRLLDPTSVGPTGEISPDAVDRLVIRRHRNSPEVAAVVGDKWAKRSAPNNILIDPSPQELAVARELKETWTGANPPCGTDHLFPWTLIKAFLSSPAALAQSVGQRLTKNPTGAEQQALDRLKSLSDELDASTSNKFRALLDYLEEIGVNNRSSMRVVIFSERVATLTWLEKELTRALKLKAGQIAQMDGSLDDERQQQLVEEFKKESSPLRILVTGDVASEGVNLHLQCHQLIHYDIPWSLIRIQQRNGRIDRYNQRISPVITTLLLDTPEDASPGDLHVLTKLMDREYNANEALGDVASLMGEHSEKREENVIRDVLARRREFDDAVQTPDEVLTGCDEWFQEFLCPTTTEADTTADVSGAGSERAATLYASELDFLEDSLLEAFDNSPGNSLARGGVGWRVHGNGVIELTPPDDLRRRLEYLPQDYVKARGVLEQIQLVTKKLLGEQQLEQARNGLSDTTWPQAHYLSPLHPVSEWAADRALASMDRQEIPVVRGDVTGPTVLCMGTVTNNRGQVITRSFIEVGPLLDEVLTDVAARLTQLGLGPNAVNPGPVEFDADQLTATVSTAVQRADGNLQQARLSAEQTSARIIERWKRRARRWSEEAEQSVTSAERRRQKARIDKEESLALQLRPDQSFVRPLLVIVPEEN